MDKPKAKKAVLDPLVAKIMQSQAGRWSDAPDRWSLTLPKARLQTLEVSQRWNDGMPDMARIEDLTFHTRDGNQNRLRLFVPQDADDALIVYFHGGGWVVGDISTHEGVTRQLAVQSGCPVLSCNYRLAPEHAFPTGLHDCVDIWRGLSSGDIDLGLPVPTSIAMAGDSAGANLAFGVMLNEIVEGRALPDFGIMFYGVYGHDFTTPSYTDFATGPGLSGAEMMEFWKWYAPDKHQYSDMRAAPLAASDAQLSRIPPLYLGIAEVDPLYSENQHMRDRLNALGRDDICHVYDGVPHGFVQMNNELPIALQAIVDAASAFRSHRVP